MNQPIYIAQRDTWGAEPTPFELSAADRRHHVYIIGKTGAGKTTLIRNLLVQDIAAGHGVGLIDPHGDLADELLDHIPPWRADHLIYFNPADLDFPISLNLLANVPADDRHLVASGMISAFKSIWRDSWGPRLEYILYNALAALLECPNTTLLGVNQLLTDPTYRRWVVNQVRDPFIRAFWTDEYDSYDARFQREAIAPIQNKLGQFLLNPVLRNMLGQVRNRVDFPFIIDNQRIFIANLAKGSLGHDKSSLLGCLLTSQFQLAAMQRVTQTESDRRDFYLFIDEFQNFTTDAFTSILSEARKYRLCLTLSHQYIEQLAIPTRQAVFGNVATLVSFQVGFADAEALEKEFGLSFAAQHFIDLDRYEVLARTLNEGVPIEPFRGKSFPPIENRIGRRRKLIQHSRTRFSTQRSIVEKQLGRWMNRLAT